MSESVWGRSWWVAVVTAILVFTLCIFYYVQPLDIEVPQVWLIGFCWLLLGAGKLIGIFFDSEHWVLLLVGALLSVIVGAWIVFPDVGAEALVAAKPVFNQVVFAWGILALTAAAFGLAAAVRAKSIVEALFPATELLFGGYMVVNIFTTALWAPAAYGIFVAVTALALLAAGIKAYTV